MSVLSVHRINKKYGSYHALQDVSFEIPGGSIYGILGPNGSGKTTMLGIVLGVLKASGGSFQWLDDLSPDAARLQIGCLLETPNFYHYLSAEKNLRITAAIRQSGSDDIARVLDIAGLLQVKDKKFSTYSLGMKQRLAIAAALLGRPHVLVLDEPLNGLDPEGITEVRQLIRKLGEEGVTVILASHLLHEVELVCSHVAILKKGQLLADGRVSALLQNEVQLELRAPDMDALYRILQPLSGISNITVGKDSLLVSTPGLDAAYINEYAVQHGVYLSRIEEKRQSLEDRFMELTTPVA
ncbi:ABC transporter ATP-binding protein [Chitinophagaceae bacterium MMS25-I14]